jgi:hypothetical protein
MKKLQVIPAFLLIISVGFLIETADAQRADQAYLIRTFDLSSPDLLDIRTSGGFVQVKGSDRNDVRVEMYVRRGGRYLDDTDTRLDEFEIEIEQIENKVRAHATRESGGIWRSWRSDANISISFIVYSPRVTGVDARTSGGNISAEHLAGHIQLHTSGGNVSLKDLNGEIDARTSGGGISIENIEGKLDARTSGGTITASNSNGSLDLRTSGGSIRLDEIGGTISARTSGGSINAKLFHVGDHVDLRTSGGSITIAIPESNGYELDLQGSRVHTALRNFSGEVERNKVKGLINDGGPVIRARTSGGSVRINYI